SHVHEETTPNVTQVPRETSINSNIMIEVAAVDENGGNNATNQSVVKDTSHTTTKNAATATDTLMDADKFANASTQSTGNGLLSPFSTVTTLVIPSHALPNNRYLNEIFKVIKRNDAAILGNRKDRIWLVDFFKRRFANLDMAGYMSFQYPASNLFRVEKDPLNSKRLTLHFFDAAHPYELEFTSTGRRQRFYEVSMTLRRNSVMWCPSLCLPNEKNVILHVQGTTIRRPNAKTVNVSGESKFTVSRMPYEVLDMWYGCFSMKDRPLPRSAAVLGSFIPRGSHEMYVIGIMDVPASFIGNDVFS
ncbi:putative Unc104-like kinesin, partial [Trypanosoma cruzi]